MIGKVKFGDTLGVQIWRGKSNAILCFLAVIHVVAQDCPLKRPLRCADYLSNQIQHNEFELCSV